MLDLASILIGTGAAIGLAALLETDPVVIQKAYVPMLVEYQGYKGELVAKLLRERIRTIAREADTARGDELGIFNANASAIYILSERLNIDGLIDAIREFLGLNAYNLSPYIVHYPGGFNFKIKNETGGQQVTSTNDLKIGIKVQTADGQLFFVSASGSQSISELIDELAERFIERVDPYVLTLYYFRKEYPQGKFSKSLPMIEHSVGVVPGELKMWPILLWGIVHQRQGHYDEAILKFQEVLRLVPSFSEAMAHWGEVLIEQGHQEAGLEKMRLAAEKSFLDPTIPYQMDTIAHGVLGDTLVKLGRDEEARQAYVEGLELVPKNSFLRVSLGKLYGSYWVLRTCRNPWPFAIFCTGMLT